MRILTAILASSILFAPIAAQAKPQLAPEEQIAKALEGRVAGKPVDCVTLRDIRSSRIIDRTAILYEMNGGTIYLNRPDNGQSSLDRDDILLTDTHSSQLCSIDTVKLIDRSSRFMSGIVFLGEFVPYKKVKTASRN